MDVFDELMGCKNDGHDLCKTKIPHLESMTGAGKRDLEL